MKFKTDLGLGLGLGHAHISEYFVYDQPQDWDGSYDRSGP